MNIKFKTYVCHSKTNNKNFKKKDNKKKYKLSRITNWIDFKL